jgi:hypothetical protein
MLVTRNVTIESSRSEIVPWKAKNAMGMRIRSMSSGDLNSQRTIVCRYVAKRLPIPLISVFGIGPIAHAVEFESTSMRFSDQLVRVAFQRLHAWQCERLVVPQR